MCAKNVQPISPNTGEHSYYNPLYKISKKQSQNENFEHFKAYDILNEEMPNKKYFSTHSSKRKIYYNEPACKMAARGRL